MAERKPFVWGASGVELLQTGDTLAGASSSGAVFSLLSTATISTPVSAVEFTGLNDEYYKYIVEFSEITGTTSASLICQVQAEGSWQTSYLGFYVGKGSISPVSDNNACISYGVATASVDLQGSVILYNPHITDYYKVIEANTSSYTQPFFKKRYVYNNNAAVTGLRFLCSSGNLVTGYFKLYGLKG